MLVRHVLSQLSYAPEPFRLSAKHLSDGFHYTQTGTFCQGFFYFFYKIIFIVTLQNFNSFFSTFLLQNVKIMPKKSQKALDKSAGYVYNESRR